GYDINETRIKELRQSVDVTNEVSEVDLKKVLLPENHLPNKGTGLYFSSSQDELRQANYYIITVPTLVDKNNSPDLTPLKKASQLVGKVLIKGDVVVHESTVSPGVT